MSMIKSQVSGMGGAFTGILIAFFFGLIVLGALILSLNETGQPPALANRTLPMEVAQVTPLPPLATSTPTITTSPTATATLSPTPSPSPTFCSPPTDWVEYVVQEGDKLNALARTLQISREELLTGNCTEKLLLEPGMTILIPPKYPPTTVACVKAAGWYSYVVKPGDTLYSLARSIGYPVETIRNGNCMGSYTIYAGQAILLPKLPPPPLPTTTPTMKPQPTNTPLPPTDTVGPISRGTSTPITPSP